MKAQAASLLVLLAAMIPGYLSAQAAVSPGERVRVHTANGDEVSGILASRSSTEVRVVDRNNHESLVITQEITQIERSLGKHRKFGKTLMLSVPAAAIIGGVASALTWSRCTKTGPACSLAEKSRGEALAVSLIVGAIGGLEVGVILGLVLKHERWEIISFSGSSLARIKVRPTFNDGFGFAASIPFSGR